jgi:hypothetical protein
MYIQYRRWHIFFRNAENKKLNGILAAGIYISYNNCPERYTKGSYTLHLVLENTHRV